MSPTYKSLLEVWRELKARLWHEIAHKDEVNHRLEFKRWAPLEMWSLDKSDGPRGRKYGLVIMDEAAQVPRLSYAWQNVIRATLADYRGEAWFLSTPLGLEYFYDLWQRGQDPLRPTWRSWQYPTSSNPYIPADEIEDMRGELAESVYLQEIEAKFIEGNAMVFRSVREAATATPQAGPIPGHTYVMGADWASLQDFTVLTMMDVTTRELVAMDRFNQIDYDLQMRRVQAMYDRFGAITVVAETNSIGLPAIQRLRTLGVNVTPFTTTNATKDYAIQNLVMAFEKAEIKILRDEVLINELQRYQMHKLPSGARGYSAPVGTHDDCVMSLAMAYSRAGKQRKEAKSY